MKLIDFYEKERLTEEERNRLGKLGILTEQEEITVLDLLSELPKTIPSTDFVDQGRPLEYNLGIRFNQSGGMIAYHMQLPDGDGALFSPLYFGLTPTGETVQFIGLLQGDPVINDGEELQHFFFKIFGNVKFCYYICNVKH